MKIEVTPERRSFPRTFAGFAAVFLLAFGWSRFWIARYSDADALRNDAATYFEAAKGIWAGTQDRLLRDAAGATFSDVGYPNLLSLWFSLTSPSVWSAQLLNSLLWGFSATLVYSILRRALPSRGFALIAAFVFASSPALTSFSGKVYSEHLAIAAGLVCVWGFLFFDDVSARARAKVAALGGGLVLVLTKSGFYPCFLLLTAVFLIRRRWARLAVCLVVVLAAAPVQSRLHHGKRGVIQIAAQTAKLDLYDLPTILKCGAYNLSVSLGQKIFPAVESACRSNVIVPSTNGREGNYLDLAFRRVDEGFTYGDGARKILASPVKYAALAATTLLSGAWIEGVYPDPIADLSPGARLALWLFKVTYSTALWMLAILFFWRMRGIPDWKRAGSVLLFALAYVLAFQANVPGEQRYFFPLLPLLYLAAAFLLALPANAGHLTRKSTKKGNSNQTAHSKR